MANANGHPRKLDVDDVLAKLRATFKSGKTKSLTWRKWQLKQCWWMIADNEARICSALTADLNRHPSESTTSDIMGLEADILEHIEHLEEWTAEERPDAGFLFGRLGNARVRREPLGVALIVGAWNFPFLLTLQPLIAAITAGCAVVLKPSEVSTASEKLIVELVLEYLDSSAIAVVTGGPQETSELMSRKFDHIFFTGSASIARHVALAAAKHLTPLVLELGGQGPAIVTKTANISLAAKRIAVAKFMNAGQICLSVNHVFVDAAVHDEFIEQVAFWNDHFHGIKSGDKPDKKEQGQMCRIVSERHYDRLKALVDKTSGQVVYDKSKDRDSLSLGPIVIKDVDLNDSLLSQELFGPLLPVIRADFKQAAEYIGSLPHPLAIYIFSNDKKEVDYILNNTQSGGVTVNDALMHAGVPGAPFGGVGESGYGYYHGRYGVDAFSHKRTVVGLPNWLDKAMGSRYPPYAEAKFSPGKTVVRKRLGFKRGETMGDQRISSTSLLFSLRTIVTVGILAAVAAWATGTFST